MPEQIQKLVANLQDFGPKRLAMLGGVAALMLAIIGIAAVYLNRPAYETLYVGLDRSDINQIGMVLSEAGIGFDVDSNGTAVLVPAGRTAEARILLAEKGLPTSTNAGYELFDNVGSLGLTSFMQQVTRVRALEGEIARTIQTLSGVKVARVHLVMPERASFRRDEQQPSASVVIRYSGVDETKTALSIRHFVAAAVPGLSVDKVTVLDASGTLLAAGDDPTNTSAARSLGIERTVESQVEDNIRRALTAYLGPDNFRATVKADINTDQRQIEETIFDPNSRVERSVQIVRANENASQRAAASPTTVEQNLPEAEPTASSGPESSEESQRREETTNYEINSKRIATVSNGYDINRLSVSVVVNRSRLAEILGQGATQQMIDQRIAEIRQVVASASGLTDSRGDVITVAAVEFVDGINGEPLPETSFLAEAGRYVGTMINAAAFIIVAFLVAWFGLRPMVASLSGQQSGAAKEEDVQEFPWALPPAAGGEEAPAGALPGIANFMSDMPEDGDLDDLRNKIRRGPQDRLARMVELNEERTAVILRKWVSSEAAEAAA